MLIDFMILRGRSRTIVIAIILSWFAFQSSATRLYAWDGGGFYIQRPKLGLRGYYKYVDEERQTPNLSTKTTNRKFREAMTVATNGWVIHPDLMAYHLAFEPEWQQESFRRNQTANPPTQSYDRNTTLLDYDMGATLLKRKPLSLNFFANRKTGQIDLTNAQDADIDSDTVGTRLNFRNSTLPITIALIHRNYDQTGFYQWEEERDEARATIRHNTKHGTSQLNLLYNDAQTTHTTFRATDISSETLSTEFTNNYTFTDDNRVRLDTLIYNLEADYNGMDQTTWRLSENLFWTHSKNLLTRYRADYSRREFKDVTNEEARFSGALTHHHLDRWTTDLGVAARTNHFDGGRENLYASNLGFLYRRLIPRGSVELGADYDYGVTNRTGTQKIIPTDERLTLSTATDTFLDKEDIDLGSIVVTDLTGATVYSEDIDYQVDMVGPAVRISRTLLGAIAEGQQVLVHYNYQIEAAYDDSRFGQKYRFSLALWSFVYLAYAHSRIDQRILSGEPPDDPLDDTANTVRLSFVNQWSDTQFLYDRQERSNDASSVTRRVSQRFNFRPARNFFLTLLGDLGDRDFTDLDEEEEFYSIGTNLGWTPLPWCNMNLNYQRKSISGDRRDELDTEMAATAKAIYGIWTGSISYRLRDQDDKGNANSLRRQEVIVQITRRLW
jgi:hypothetical protein